MFLLLPLMFHPSIVLAQSGSSTDLGNTDFYTFSDGSSTTRSRIGSTDIYFASTPSVSGSTNRIGNTTFGTWQDGTTSTHQSIGRTTIHKSTNGKACTSQNIGSTRLTTCI
jgi:hypothetical protein